MGLYKASVGELKGGSLLFSNRHMSARAFRGPRILWLTRTSAAFASVAEVEQCSSDVAHVLPARERSGWRVLIDMRLSPVRVDPSFEPAYERLRRETNVGFERVAVVVETPLGRMRAERLAKGAVVSLAVVGSIEDALCFLNKE